MKTPGWNLSMDPLGTSIPRLLRSPTPVVQILNIPLICIFRLRRIAGCVFYPAHFQSGAELLVNSYSETACGFLMCKLVYCVVGRVVFAVEELW